MAVSPVVRQLLWVKSGGICAFPDCRARLIAQSSSESDVLVGEVAHIVGQREGSARFGEPIPGGQVDGLDNLVVLCPTCHEKIDKQPATFTVARLVQLKLDHERWVTDRLNAEQRLLGTHAPPDAVLETVHSTLLPVTRMPAWIHTAACGLAEGVVAERLRATRTRVMLPFIVRQGLLIAFTDLQRSDSPFRAAVPDIGTSSRVRAVEWWDDADRSRWIVSLLNRSLNKLTGRRGLMLDRDHQRYYFQPAPAERPGAPPQPREVSYRPLATKRSSRSVAWQPMSKRLGQPRNYWVHLAVALRFHRVAREEWVMSVRPEHRFTSDGYTPLAPRGTSRRSTRRAARSYNAVLLADLQFWRDFLSNGQPRMILDFGGQSLVVENRLMAATVSWPGVPNDAVTFDNAEYEDDLFSAAALAEALEEGGDEAEASS